MVRAEQLRLLEKGQKVHPGSLDFSSYAQAHDRRYLGFQGELYLGRPCKNDSSSITAVINPAEYWRRYYYKPEGMKETLEATDDVAEKKYGRRPPPADLSGVFELADSLREDILVADKPPAVNAVGSSLTFHNTLSNKYTDVLGYYDYCKTAHSSSKAERDFILANYYRKDTNLQLRREETLKRKSSLRTHFPNDFQKKE